MDWFAVLPRSVAIQQAAWERHQAILRERRVLRSTYAAMGRRHGISPQQVSKIVTTANRAGPAPVLRYLRSDGDLAELARWATGRFRRRCERCGRSLSAAPPRCRAEDCPHG